MLCSVQYTNIRNTGVTLIFLAMDTVLSESSPLLPLPYSGSPVYFYIFGSKYITISL